VVVVLVVQVQMVLLLAAHQMVMVELEYLLQSLVHH
jgi:hypothetical protein